MRVHNYSLWFALALIGVLGFGQCMVQAQDLSDGEGWVWDVETDGGIDDGFHGPSFWSDTFDCFFELDVDGSSYSPGADLTSEDEGRELITGLVVMATDVEVQRKIYVPEDYAFARFINCFTNTGTNVLNFTVEIGGDLGSDGDSVFVGSSGHFEDSSEYVDRWYIGGGDADDPTFLHYFDGPGGSLTGTATFDPGEDDPCVFWDITLQPGETKYIIVFSGLRYSWSEQRELVTFLEAHPEIAFAKMTSDELEKVCNWVAGDADGDGLVDVWETMHNVSDAAADDDNDGLTNQQEYDLGTDPSNADTDGDGLNDGAEVNIGSDPLDSDSDDDSLSDGVEDDLGTDPLDADSDDDLVSDGKEVSNNTDPNVFSDYSANYDVFVGPNGDDNTGDGTQANPFFSIGRATEEHPDFVATKSLLIGEDERFTIFVGSGYYNLIEDNFFSGLDNMSIHGAGLGVCTLDGDDNAWDAFCFSDCRNLEISGFSIENVGIAIDGDGDFDGLEIHDLFIRMREDCDAINLRSEIPDAEVSLHNLQIEDCGDAICYRNDFLLNKNQGLANSHGTGTGDDLTLNAIKILGSDSNPLDLNGLNEEGTLFGNLEIRNVSSDHASREFRCAGWDTLVVSDCLIEGGCSGGFRALCIGTATLTNVVVATSEDDPGFELDDIDNLVMRNCSVVNTGDYDGMCLDTITSTTIRNCLLTSNDGYGISFTGDPIDEDYNAFFDNSSGDVTQDFKQLFIGNNDITGIDPLITDASMGVFFPTDGSPLLGAGDDLDAETGTLDDNIGTDNTDTAIAGGHLVPDGGTDDMFVEFTDSDPDNDSHGAGIRLNLIDLNGEGDVSIILLDNDEKQELLVSFPLKDAAGDIIDIDVTAAFVTDAGNVFIILPLPEGVSNPAIYHFNAVSGEWEKLSNAVIDKDLGIIIAEFDPANGFSPFGVGGGGSNLIFSNGGGGSVDFLTMALLVMLAGFFLLRRRMS